MGAAGKVHSGFSEAFTSVQEYIFAAIKRHDSNRPIYVTGHSLGAALAQLAAIHFADHNMNIAGVYTYGSPRVGNKDFVEAYNQQLGRRTHLHVNNKDIVTALPPKFIPFGYQHVNEKPHHFDIGHKLTLQELISELDTCPEHERDATLERVQQAANDCIRDCTAHLRVTELRQNDAAPTYDATFERGVSIKGQLDDHGIANYVFKFACSIIDEKLGELKW
jgi:hypothetical protein